MLNNLIVKTNPDNQNQQEKNQNIIDQKDVDNSIDKIITDECNFEYNIAKKYRKKTQ